MNKRKKKQQPKYRSIGKIQEIHWYDHNSHSGWTDGIPTDLVAQTYGRVVDENERYVQIAGTTCTDDPKISMVLNIIKSCILKRRTLR